MSKRKVRGNYKDYVVIAEGRLIDWSDSWDILAPDGQPLGFDGVVLMHKRALAGVLGERFASKFWNSSVRRRVPPQQRNPNAVVRRTPG